MGIMRLQSCMTDELVKSLFYTSNFKDLIVTSQMNNKKYKSTVWLVWFLLYKFKFKSVKV